MPKRLPPLIAAVCAIAAAGVTGYCTVQIGPTKPALAPQGAKPPSVLYPFSVGTLPRPLFGGPDALD